jgi:hypothetical protein
MDFGVIWIVTVVCIIPRVYSPLLERDQLETVPKRRLTASFVCPRIGTVSSNERVKRARVMTLLLGTCAKTFQRWPTAAVCR